MTNHTSDLPGQSPATPATRTGRSPLEQTALRRVRTCLAALPARTLVQVALWPETVQGFATWGSIRPAHAYNTLSQANGRPYHAIRTALAHRLGLTKTDVDQVLERPCISLEELPAEEQAFAWGRTAPSQPSFDRTAPEVPFRDGSLALEQLALLRMETNLAALPKGMILQLLHWPLSLRELAAALNVDEQVFYNLLSFQRGMRYPEVRARFYAAYAQHGIEPSDFDHLVEAAPAEAIPLPEVAPLPVPPRGRRRRE